MMNIGFYIFPGFQLLDLSGPLTAFQLAGQSAAAKPYRLTVISDRGGEIASSSGVPVCSQAWDDQRLDTLIICGGAGVHALLTDKPVLARLHAATQRCRRIASVCTGAFALAELGLLDGRRATTHWHYVARLQKAYPRIQMDGDKIYIRDGHIWTSAGITSGIDLALALIEQDLGLNASRDAAQYMVVYQRRTGGQSQFSPALQMEPETERVRKALDYAQQHLDEPLDLEQLADIACLSVRQFSRLFKAETGETPARAIERMRVEAACARMERQREQIGKIARAVGFENQERMRRAFLRWLGHPPQVMKRRVQDSLPA